MDPTRMMRTAFVAAGLLTTALLTACNGGGGGGGSAVVGNDAFIAKVSTVVATMPDNTDPESTDDIAATSPDTSEPVTVVF